MAINFSAMEMASGVSRSTIMFIFSSTNISVGFNTAFNNSAVCFTSA